MLVERITYHIIGGLRGVTLSMLGSIASVLLAARVAVVGCEGLREKKCGLI
jgi:hypothetical protein